MSDIVIYQMGKVASNSIQEALLSAGLQAAHAHFLGDRALTGIVKTLTNPHRSHPDFIKHGTGQLLLNIETTRLVNWYKHHKTKNGERLKIVTLARDPISWCRANLLQNFNMYFHGIRIWGKSNLPGIEESAGAYLGPFFQSVFDTLPGLKTPLDAPGIDKAVHQLEIGGMHPGVIREHILTLARPLKWFDVQLKETLAVDIYTQVFEPDMGFQTYENDFCEVLLVKFEQLPTAWADIGQFVGLTDLPVHRKNTSGEKPHSAEVAAAFDGLTATPLMLSKIYDSKYCQFFDYKPAPSEGPAA